MSKPMLLDAFTRLPAVTRAATFAGLSGLIDVVAAEAPATHRFLRYQWFAAALPAVGGEARTIVVEQEGDPVIALPLVTVGPRRLRIATIPGGGRPFRGFPASIAASADAFDVLAMELARGINLLRLGPTAADDHAVAALLAALGARGWRLREDRCPDNAGFAPLPSDTMVKCLDGAALVAGEFASLAAMGGDLTFWRSVASDPAVAAMLSARIFASDGIEPGFELVLDTGANRHVVARGGGLPGADERGAPLRCWELRRPGLAGALARLLAPRQRTTSRV